MDCILMILCFAGVIAFVVGFIMLIVKSVKHDSKKGALITMLVGVLLFVVCPMIAPEETQTTQTQQIEYNAELEGYYTQIVAYATQGNSQEGDKLYKQHAAQLQNYKDAINYANYCVGLTAYNAGGLSYALSAFQLAGNVLDSQKYISDIQSQYQLTNGNYKADNGTGSYLYIGIKDGEVASDIIGYYDTGRSFAPTTYTYSLLRFVSDNGAVFYGIGRYVVSEGRCDVSYYIHPNNNMQSFTCNARPYNSYDNPNPVTTFEGTYSRIS